MRTRENFAAAGRAHCPPTGAAGKGEGHRRGEGRHFLLTTFLFATALAWCAPVAAQQAAPPAGAPAKQQPGKALDVSGEEPAEGPAKPAKPKEEGITLIGERESPIGLYLTPWKNSLAEKDIDRPARLLQEELLPLDEDVFVRNLEYYEALTGALKSKKAVTPPLPDAQP